METCTPGVQMIGASWGMNQPLTAMFLYCLQRTSMHLCACTEVQRCAAIKQFLQQSSGQDDIRVQLAVDMCKVV